MLLPNESASEPMAPRLLYRIGPFEEISIVQCERVRGGECITPVFTTIYPLYNACWIRLSDILAKAGEEETDKKDENLSGQNRPFPDIYV